MEALRAHIEWSLSTDAFLVHGKGTETAVSEDAPVLSVEARLGRGVA